MLARQCCYTSTCGADLSVYITVHPCCTIEIDIPEKRQIIRRDVDQLHFKLTNQGMLLVCDESDDSRESDIQLHFSRKDALALCQIIDEVIEEHEDLMSALC